MKVVLLAGGFGTRLSEETEVKPKPMVDIGGRPILWHIMKHYAQAGFTEFAIALGYKGEDIKHYFVEYLSLQGSLTLNLAEGIIRRHDDTVEDWKIHLVDTGLETNTGGRLNRMRDLLSDGPFMLTYGDGVSDIDLNALLDFHNREGRLATITAVRPPSRFGGLELVDGRVAEFTEKPQTGEGWINGGFMVCEPEILDRITTDHINLERDILEKLAKEGQLSAWRHEGFWQCMDTLRDVRYLRALWEGGSPPWRTWA